MGKINEIKINDLVVRTKLDCDTLIIKLYEVPKCNRNIVGENKQGEILWQVEDISPNEDAPFTNIMPYNDKKIKAYNWIGMYYFIDIQTGKLDMIDARPW